MQIQAKFQSSYGLALYENCNRYQDIGQTPWFELDKFRKLMGVEDSKYKIFRDFKVRVLDKSIEEVNKYSSLSVEAKLKKQNRQVVALQFVIKNKVTVHSSPISIDRVDDAIQIILKEKFGLSQSQITDTLKKYEEPYIKEKIEIIETSSSYQIGKIKNLGKYLLCALADDYQPVKKITTDKTKELKQITEQDELAYQKYCFNKIFESYHLLDDKSKNTLMEQFALVMARSTFAGFYNAYGLENHLVQDQFVKFIMGHANVISNELKSFDTWYDFVNSP
jgi:plasmid replication initiation protein